MYTHLLAALLAIAMVSQADAAVNSYMRKAGGSQVHHRTILPAETRAKMRYPDAAEQYLKECCPGHHHGSGGGAGKIK